MAPLSGPSTLRARRYRGRLTPGQKVNLVTEFMRQELNMSPAEYIKLLFDQTDRFNKLRQKAFFDVAYTSPELLKYLDNHPHTRLEVLKALKWGVSDLRTELATLIESPEFGPFRSSSSMEDLSNFNAASLTDSMTTAAPNLTNLLMTISDTPRPWEPISDQGSVLRQARLAMVLSILCYNSRPRTSTHIQTTTGLYLYSKGTKRSAIELLHQFGLTVSYDRLLTVTRELSAHSAKAVAQMGQSPNAITAYDNFEQMEGVQEQRVDDNSVFHSITTGKVFEGIEMPVGGLRQDMLDSKRQLQVCDVVFSPGNRPDSTHDQVNYVEPLNTLLS
jgi:hypothetical protein